MRSRRNPSYGIYLGDLDRRYTESQGIISYALALTRAIERGSDPDERLVVFCSAAVGGELGDVLLQAVWRCGRRPPAGVRQQVHQEQFGVVRQVAQSGVDVIHFPKGRAPWRSLGPAKVVRDDPRRYPDAIPGRQLRDATPTSRARTLSRTCGGRSRRPTRFSPTPSSRAGSSTSVDAARPSPSRCPGTHDWGGCRMTATAHAPRFVVFDSPFAHKRADEAAEFTFGTSRAWARRSQGAPAWLRARFDGSRSVSRSLRTRARPDRSRSG